MPSTLDRSLLAIERETSALTLPESRHGYDEARRVFNSMFDRRPSAIVRPRQSSDIERIVSILVQDGHRFTIRGGGHSIAGTCVADGTVMLDMSLLRRVTFDETTGIASAEPGALWCDYDAVTTRFGVASTGDIVSHTGVAGLVLGGGLGWLMGLAGLGCDALVGVDCYSSAGHVEHLDEDDPDLQLFRGAGRSLGVATELRFRPIPIPSQITAGRATTPLESAAEMFHLTDTSSEGWPAWVTVSPALVNRDGRWIGILDFVSTESTEKTTEVVRRCLPSDVFRLTKCRTAKRRDCLILNLGLDVATTGSRSPQTRWTSRLANISSSTSKPPRLLRASCLWMSFTGQRCGNRLAAPRTDFATSDM